MSKKILLVNADADRQMSQSIEGSFYSTHKQEDIEKWLSHKHADTNDNCFEEVFGGDWYDQDCWDGLETCAFGFKETEDADEGYCEFDDEIQEFIDEEPKRERDKGIRTVTYQLKDMIGNMDGIKDTSRKLFEDYLDLIEKTGVGIRRENKKGEESWNLEKCNDEENKLFYTLRDLVQLTLKFPKPKVEKETHEPF